MYLINWVVTTDWSSFTCKQDWWSLCELLSGMVCSGTGYVLPLNESAPSLRSLSGKTLDVQGRKIVQLDCGNGHSLSVQFYVCTGIQFPLVSVARLLLQDFWTVMAKDYFALIDPIGNRVPIVRQGTLIYLCSTYHMLWQMRGEWQRVVFQK